LISSVRPRQDISVSGWWTVFPHRAWVMTEEFKVGDDVDRDGVMTLAGATGTFQEFRAGIETPDGRRVMWIGNKRLGQIQVQEYKWQMNLNFTLENYQNVLTGKEYLITEDDGSTRVVKGDDFSGAFFNSLAVTIPATVIPILIAAFAAYGFAWLRFPGRKAMFTIVVALLVVPLQIALVPILRDYVKLQLNGTFLAIWLAHTGFGVPLAILEQLVDDTIATAGQ
jgi:alpha-glucoside transport system permease protein